MAKTEEEQELATMVHELNVNQACGCTYEEEQRICRILRYLGPQEQRVFARLLIQYRQDIPGSLENIPEAVKVSSEKEAQVSGIPAHILCMAWLLFDGPDFNPVMGRIK